MSDLIRRRDAIDAAIDAVDEWDGGYNRTRGSMIENAINSLPMYAEQKQGKWLKREYVQVCEDGYESAICSECGADITLEYSYDSFCPNCGARMLGEDGEA